MVECVIGTFKVHVEIPTLLIFFAFTVSDSVKTNLIIYRTCYLTLNYNESECALLGSARSDNVTEHIEKIVEPYAAVITMTNSLMEQCFTVVICLFVGPWSDRFGRKYFILIPFIGFTLAFIMLAVFSVLPNVSPWYFLFCSIPVMLTGGGSSFITVTLCYISDVTSESNRGTRMALFEAALSLGIFLGNISSSFILSATNYETVFMISSTCCVLALLYTWFFVPESVTNRETEGQLRGLFQLSNIKEMLRTTFKKREKNDRATLIICILSLTLYITAVSEGSVPFMFLREKFQWSLEHYTLYTAAHNVAYIVSTLFGVYFLHKLLKVPETILILIGFICLVNGYLVQGLASRDWEIYAAGGVRSIGGVLGPMARSLISKIVPQEEAGKVFALIVTSESLFATAGSPIYTSIYNETININPSIYNFVSAGLYMVEVILAIAMVTLRTKRSNETSYNTLTNDNIEGDSEEPQEEPVSEIESLTT